MQRNLDWLATASSPLPPAADEPTFRH